MKELTARDISILKIKYNEMKSHKYCDKHDLIHYACEGCPTCVDERESICPNCDTEYSNHETTCLECGTKTIKRNDE
jgi:hypothetical protein